jgi:putative glycosyltransferase (TIGR04372 family)
MAATMRATQHRTEFGDVYLLATCKFVVAGSAGLWNLSSAFNRPVVVADHNGIEYRGLREGDLFLPVMYRRRADQRFLTFREMLAAGSRYAWKEGCLADGVEYVRNTSEEITAVVDEMDRRLDGTWVGHPDEEVLQGRFRALYTPAALGYGTLGRIGTEFLRQHADLL